MPLTAGNSYSVTLGVSTSVSITVTMIVATIEFGTDVNQAAFAKVHLETNGQFSASLV